MRFCWLPRLRHRHSWLGLTFIQGRSSTLHHFGNNPVPIEAWKEHPDTYRNEYGQQKSAASEAPTTAL
jgi:hypothetical protein